MRIEAGEWRGHRLSAPQGGNTRPTDGRTRAMLFDSLGAFVIGARVLDLYAGSGSVGLEALSRGAAFCTFVEMEHAALRALNANVKNLRCSDRVQVWNGNARSALPRLAENGAKFDLIFADPPFRAPEEAGEIAKRLDGLLQLLNNENVGSNSDAGQNRGLIVIQHARRTPLPPLEHLELRREKKAGESRLSFFVPRFESDDAAWAAETDDTN